MVNVNVFELSSKHVRTCFILTLPVAGAVYYVYAFYFSEPECRLILVCQYAIVLNIGSSFDDGCELWHCIKNNNIILGTKYNACKYTGYVVYSTITVVCIL